MAAVGIIGGLALVATACGEAPEDSEVQATDFKACMVTDVGGIEDASFNASSWKGMNSAAEEEPGIEVSYKKSEKDTDYEPNMKNSVKDGCDLTIGVGGLMAEATAAVAKDNPDKRFAIIDAKLDLPNVVSMEFNAAAPSFLAGYLAADMSKSGKVGTFGGESIAPVMIFMDGFAKGVEHYNEEEDKNVEVLGWSGDPDSGVFTKDFQSTSKGTEQAKTLISKGADILFPVAGQAGLGAPMETSKEDDQYSIWVDIDGCESAEKYCDEFLTTSEKNIPAQVKKVILDAYADGDKSGSSIGLLENDGVGLSGFHEDVPKDLREDLKKIEQGLISGDIPLESEFIPKAVEDAK